METPSLIAETMKSPFFCLFSRDAIVRIISERIRLLGQNTVVFRGMFSNVAVTSFDLTMFICSIMYNFISLFIEINRSVFKSTSDNAKIDINPLFQNKKWIKIYHACVI